MDDEQDGTITQQDGTISKPFIHLEFNGELSAEVSVSIGKCSPFMLWGAAQMLQQMAADQWQNNQLAQMAQEAKSSRLITARGMPQDHLRKVGN